MIRQIVWANQIHNIGADLIFKLCLVMSLLDLEIDFP